MSFVNPRIHVGDAIESAFNWLTDHAGWLFDAIKTVITGLYDAFNTVLSSPPYYVMIAIFAALALLAAGWRQGWKLAIFAVIGFYFIRAFDQWVNAMNTIALVLVSVIIALIIALPIGILAARSRVVSSIVRPVLDLMQTLPGLVYLVPVIIVFGIGPTPGVVSTLIFAMPPGIRLTELAIRQVDPEVSRPDRLSAPARLASSARSRSRWPCRRSWQVSIRSSCWRCRWSSSPGSPVPAGSAARSTRRCRRSTSHSVPKPVWPW